MLSPPSQIGHWTMFLPGLSFATYLLYLSFWRKLHNKPTIAIFNSSSSTSITLKKKNGTVDEISLAIVALTCWLLMQSRTSVVETPRHCKVRRQYAVRTQYILYNTPMIKMIRYSIAPDTLWIKTYAIGTP